MAGAAVSTLMAPTSGRNVLDGLFGMEWLSRLCLDES